MSKKLVDIFSSPKELIRQFLSVCFRWRSGENEGRVGAFCLVVEFRGRRRRQHKDYKERYGKVPP